MPFGQRLSISLKGRGGVLLLFCLLCLAQPALAWDGRWTSAPSGEWPVIDPGSTEGMSYTKERPQTYILPPARNYGDVDPEEFDELSWKDKTPFAPLQLNSTYIAGGKVIPPGFYQIKLGQYDDGSPNVQLDPTLVNAFLKEQQARTDAEKADKKWYSWLIPEKKYAEDHFQTLIIKQAGKVLLVLPIESITPYLKSRGEKLPGESVVWVDTDENPAQLKFFYKKMVFATNLKPGG
ncbi:MAG: hypothetical protein AB7P76_11530 [Candidatus Melainabacteria bacterium]